MKHWCFLGSYHCAASRKECCVDCPHSLKNPMPLSTGKAASGGDLIRLSHSMLDSPIAIWGSRSRKFHWPHR